MSRTILTWLAVALVSGGSLLAHHSLASYDTTKAVRVKGTILQLHLINPHSIIYLAQTQPNGQIFRWAVEGPSVLQVKRRGLTSLLKPGDVVEVCGYLPKEAIIWQIASRDGSASLSGRLLNGELLVTSDGEERSWGDYGVHKCFAPAYSDQHAK